MKEYYRGLFYGNLSELLWNDLEKHERPHQIR